MHKKSTNHNIKGINPNIKTAIIYSTDELFTYTIEIQNVDSSYFIADDNGKVLHFGNMGDARQATLKENAEVAFLALSKTCEETDISICHADHHDRYDYSPMELNIKSH